MQNARNVPSVISPWSASQPPTRQHRHLTERGDRLHRGLEPGLDVHEANPRREHLLRPIGEALELAGLLAEALHDPHAGDVFLDDVGDLAGLLLRVPTRREHRCAQPHRGDEEQGRDRQHDEREQRRQPQHGAERHDEQQDVRDADGQELQEALHERDVGRGPADELAGRHLVVAGEVESLQLGEDRGAQVVLHVERDAPAPEATEIGEDEGRDAHQDHQDEPRRERFTVTLSVLCLGRDDVVDHDALHQRQQ